MADETGEEVHPLRRRIEESVAQMHGYRSLDEVGTEDDGFYGKIADCIIADLGLTYVGQWCPWKGYGIREGSDEPDEHKWQRLYHVKPMVITGGNGEQH